MDRETVNIYSGELTRESYMKHYSSMITGKFFKESNDFAVNKDEDGNIEVEGNIEDKVGDENVSIVGKIAVKLIDLVEEKLSNVKTIEIAESNGDVTKLPYDKQFSATATLLETLQESQGMESEYVDTYLRSYEFIKSKKKEFRRAFKDSNKNLLSMFYITLILYQIEMTSIMASSLLAWVEDGSEIDKQIDQREEYMKVFERVRGMLDDEELNDFMSIDFRKDLISESNVSGNFLMLYSETSINDTIRLFKLGLAKFLHKLTGFFRFIVYMFFYAKFSIQQKIQKINTVLDLYNTDNKDERSQLLDEAKKMDREYKVNTIDAVDRAEKQQEKEKIDIEDTDGFAL